MAAVYRLTFTRLGDPELTARVTNREKYFTNEGVIISTQTELEGAKSTYADEGSVMILLNGIDPITLADEPDPVAT